VSLPSRSSTTRWPASLDREARGPGRRSLQVQRDRDPNHAGQESRRHVDTDVGRKLPQRRSSADRVVFRRLRVDRVPSTMCGQKRREPGAEPTKLGAERHARRGPADWPARLRGDLRSYSPRTTSCGSRPCDASSCASGATRSRCRTDAPPPRALRRPGKRGEDEHEDPEDGRDQSDERQRPARRTSGNCRPRARHVSFGLQDRGGGGMERSPLLVGRASCPQPDGQLMGAREHTARPDDARGRPGLGRRPLCELCCSRR
jgi:hypothetical protein